MNPVPVECPFCHTAGQNSVFCKACGRYLRDPSGTVERVTHNRRFWGDNLLELVVYAATLIVGWYIWLYFTAQTAQTPAKRLLNVYVLDLETGRPVAAGRIWVRDVVVKQLLLGVLGSLLGLIPSLADAVWVLFDRNRQALHDKVHNTIVVYAPQGLPEALTGAPSMSTVQSNIPGRNVAEQLRELSRLRAEGILTEDEYESKRRQLAEHL